MNERMREIIDVIEAAGIKVTKSAYAPEENQVHIEVSPEDEARALEVVNAHFMRKQQEHLEHIGLIAVPIEEESK
jgi:type III secretory pathway lipoprotein EscJ